MFKLLKKIFLKDSDNFTYWIIFALAFRIILFILYLLKRQYGEVPGFIGIVSGDFYYYITSIENYISKGSYYPDFRMPGYGIVYYFLRFLADQDNALNIIIILQYFLSAISVYCLAVTARNIFNNKKLFYICFYLYLINTFAAKYDSYSQPDSFTCSATIFTFYFFEKFIRESKYRYIIFAGILMCWVVFLRPVYLPLYAVLLIILMYYFLKKKILFVNLIKYVVLLMLPFLIFESMWIYRNYKKYNEIIILQKSMYYDDTKNTFLIYLVNFIQSWGGDFIKWNPKAEITWFGFHGKNDTIVQAEENTKLPAYIYTSKFNADSLIKIKQYICIYQDKRTDSVKREKINQHLSTELKLYSKSIREEKPFLYYFKAPVILFKNFLFHPSKYHKDKINVSFIRNLKSFYNSFLYLFVINTGLAGIVFLLITNFSFDIRFTITGITLYSLIIFPIILRLIEYRYLVPAYPFLTVCSAYLLNQLISMQIWQRLKYQSHDSS
jgi:hypothetical protein